MPRKLTGSRGGPRPGSGPKTRYPGKNPKPVCVLLTDDARARLRDAMQREGASRSDVLEALTRAHADHLRLPPKPMRLKDTRAAVRAASDA